MLSKTRHWHEWPGEGPVSWLFATFNEMSPNSLAVNDISPSSTQSDLVKRPARRFPRRSSDARRGSPTGSSQPYSRQLMLLRPRSMVLRLFMGVQECRAKMGWPSEANAPKNESPPHSGGTRPSKRLSAAKNAISKDMPHISMGSSPVSALEETSLWAVK